MDSDSKTLYDELVTLGNDLLYKYGDAQFIYDKYDEIELSLKTYHDLDDDHPIMKIAMDNGFVIPGEDVSFEEVFDEIDRIYDQCSYAGYIADGCIVLQNDLQQLAKKGYDFPVHEDRDVFNIRCRKMKEEAEELLADKHSIYVDYNLEEIEIYAASLIKDVKKWEGL